MNLGFHRRRHAAHEFGHAIGLAHEHQNPAGGIQWNEAGRDSRTGQVAQLLGRSHDAPQRPAQVHGGPGQRDGVRSRFDHAVLLSRRVDAQRHRHQGQRSAVAHRQGVHRRRQDVPEDRPTVDDADRARKSTRRAAQPASIGKVGEEDLFTFTAAKDGRHVVDTTGPTDVVMKLFGPNSHTALIAEDDDSGVDYNARICCGPHRRRLLRSGAALQPRQRAWATTRSRSAKT